MDNTELERLEGDVETLFTAMMKTATPSLNLTVTASL